MFVSYLKIGERNGAKRLWFQGRRLEKAGIQPGLTYDIQYHDDQSLTITLRDGGTHRVSSKKQGDTIVPVIDLNNRALDETFGKDITRVRAIIRPGAIEVRIHPDDAAAKQRVDRLVSAIRDERPLRVGSLAHGGGVLDHALHDGLARAGVKSELAFAVEIDPDYLECSLRNNPVWTERSIAICAPMEEVETGLLPSVDILAAGLPCVGASLAGRAKNGNRHAEQHETAGHLFVAFLNIIKAVNPGIVILEEVVPYSTSVSMGVIRQVLTQWGYRLHETVLDERLGALEARKRMCMVAVSDGLAFDWAQLVPVRAKEGTIREILEDVPPDDPAWREYAYLNAKEQKDIAAGKGFRQQLLTPESPICGTIGRSYNKVRSTEPRLRHPTDQSLTRLLTPREHARVKTIPEHLVDGQCPTTAHEILGQSVIHAAFVAVGALIGKMLVQGRYPARPNCEVRTGAVSDASQLQMMFS